MPSVKWSNRALLNQNQYGKEISSEETVRHQRGSKINEVEQEARQQQDVFEGQPTSNKTDRTNFPKNTNATNTGPSSLLAARSFQTNPAQKGRQLFQKVINGERRLIDFSQNEMNVVLDYARSSDRLAELLNPRSLNDHTHIEYVLPKTIVTYCQTNECGIELLPHLDRFDVKDVDVRYALNGSINTEQDLIRYLESWPSKYSIDEPTSSCLITDIHDRDTFGHIPNRLLYWKDNLNHIENKRRNSPSKVDEEEYFLTLLEYFQEIIEAKEHTNGLHMVDGFFSQKVKSLSTKLETLIHQGDVPKEKVAQHIAQLAPFFRDKLLSEASLEDSMLVAESRYRQAFGHLEHLNSLMWGTGSNDEGIVELNLEHQSTVEKRDVTPINFYDKIFSLTQDKDFAKNMTLDLMRNMAIGDTPFTETETLKILDTLEDEGIFAKDEINILITDIILGSENYNLPTREAYDRLVKKELLHEETYAGRRTRRQFMKLDRLIHGLAKKEVDSNHAKGIVTTMLNFMSLDARKSYLAEASEFRPFRYEEDEYENEHIRYENIWDYVSAHLLEDKDEIMKDLHVHSKMAPIWMSESNWMYELDQFPNLDKTKQTYQKELEGLNVTNFDIIPSRVSEVLRNWSEDACRNDKRPIALFLQSPEDWNGASAGKPVDQLFRGYRVLYAQVADEQQIKDTVLKAESILGDKDVDLLVIDGHGDRTTLALGDQDPSISRVENSERTLDTRDGNVLQETFRHIMKDDGDILLNSCSNGKWGLFSKNLQTIVHEAIPHATIHAYPDPNNGVFVLDDKGLFLNYKLTYDPNSQMVIKKPSRAKYDYSDLE